MVLWLRPRHLPSGILLPPPARRLIRAFHMAVPLHSPTGLFSFFIPPFTRRSYLVKTPLSLARLCAFTCVECALLSAFATFSLRLRVAVSHLSSSLRRIQDTLCPAPPICHSWHTALQRGRFHNHRTPSPIHCFPLQHCRAPSTSLQSLIYS